MRKSARTAAALLTAGLAVGVSANAGSTSAAPATNDAPRTSAYMPGSSDAAQNKRARALVKKALAYADQQGPAKTRNQYAATVYYSVTNAPAYASYIRQGAAIWNNSVGNVKLVENNSYATLDYYQGSDPNGSHYRGDMHGRGYILLDPAQMNVYHPVRIASHETGHALGLYDNYDGPCSELMSGGGQPPSCTNPYPNSAERSRVEALWAYGFMASQGKTPNAAPKALATN